VDPAETAPPLRARRGTAARRPLVAYWGPVLGPAGLCDGYPRGMSYTIVNLAQVEDKAPKFGLDSVQEARFPASDLAAEQTGLAYMRIKPSQRQAFAHRHQDAEEIYVILAGSGTIKVGEDRREVGPLDAICVTPKQIRAFEAGPDGLEYIVFGPHHQGDGEIIHEGFWE
jgi:mannose-6-phosphate isomerase-like protein (cupin superfamily)